MMETNTHTVYERDPFAVDPLPKAHYYPSPERRLTQSQKTITISPNRTQKNASTRQQQDDRLSPMDELFMKGTNMYQSKPTEQTTHDDVYLDESWPSSERQSSLNLTGFEDESPIDFERYQSTIDRFTDLKQTLKFPDRESPSVSPQRVRQPGSSGKPAGITVPKRQENPSKSKVPVRSDKKTVKIQSKDDRNQQNGGKVDGSVLQSYIDRFRNSAPLSREERQQQCDSSSRDFWWLSSSNPSTQTDSSVPKEDKGGGKSTGVAPLTTVNLDKYKHLQKLGHAGYGLSFSEVPASPGDKRTVELQERADRLLERSTSTIVSTDPAVSTEGLGSNMSDVSSLQEYPYRPKFANYLETDQISKYEPQPMPRPRQNKPHPEDDPLCQWRLRRRMETAQETAPKNIQSFGFLDKSEQQRKIESKLEEFKRKLAGKDPSSPQSTHRSANYQFTPAPQVTRVEESMLQPPVQQRFPNEPQIASPTLQRRKSSSDPPRDVDPHLHLMCDLLPCPHQGKYQESLGQQPKSRQDNNSVKGDHSKSACDSENKGDNYDVKLSASEERKYKQYLEAEKPDIDIHKSDISGDIREVPTKRDDKTMTCDNRDKNKNKGRHKHVDDGDRDLKEKTTKNNKYRESLERNDDKTKLSPRRGDKRSDHDLENQQKELRSKDSWSVDRKDKLPRPTGSSSPKVGRKGVDMAIGQAVKDHLFSMSTSTVLSSVESLPPAASHDRLPRKHKQQTSNMEDRRQDDGDELESDEEFPTDHLLQMLRKQRSLYEQQLQDIDQMLTTLDGK